MISWQIHAMSPTLKATVQLAFVVNVALLIYICGLLIGYTLNPYLVAVVAFLLVLLVRQRIDARKKS